MLTLLKKIDWKAVASDLGVSRNVAYLRFYRLKASLEKADSNSKSAQQLEDVKEEATDMVKAESRASTPAEEKEFHVEVEPMEEA